MRRSSGTIGRITVVTNRQRKAMVRKKSVTVGLLVRITRLMSRQKATLETFTIKF